MNRFQKLEKKTIWTILMNDRTSSGGLTDILTEQTTKRQLSTDLTREKTGQAGNLREGKSRSRFVLRKDK